MKKTIPFFYRNNFVENRKLEIENVIRCSQLRPRGGYCLKSAIFKKIENIGPRYYAVYSCQSHPRFRIRINEYTPLKKKCHICNKMVDPKDNKEGHCFEDTCKAKKLKHKVQEDPLTLY